ncbi:MAG: site-2 protease family protein [Rhizobiaceae bacterium]
MAWSFPLIRIFGSEIRIHITFLLLLLWIGVAHYNQGGGEAATVGVLFILALFACVVAHEFGHALAARRYGIDTPDITLLPIGGLARLERMPEKPSEEIVVAIAGPLVNVVIALVLIVVFGAEPGVAALEHIDDPAAGFLSRLATVNIFLVVFNMIPAFPMDGGRVFRAILATRYNRARATRIAARVGQGFAFLLGFLGLLGNPLLIFIAIFVYIAATAEAQATELQQVSRGISAGDAMITSFETLGPDATIGDAADALLRTTQVEFPVLEEDGGLAGFVTRSSMIEVLAKSGADAPARAAMQADIPSVTPGDRLEAALKAMQKATAPAVAVIDRSGRFVGYITAENIGELVMLETSAGRL